MNLLSNWDESGILFNKMSSVEKSLIETEPKNDDPATTKKDSWYSWFICFNGWLTQVLILGVLHGFGVFFVEFVADFKSSKSNAGENVSDEITSENDERDQKDTLVSWFVCACGFIPRVLMVGVLHGFGPFFIAFIREFRITKEQSAWIGSLAYGLSMTFGPIASMLTNRFGNRIIMVIGALMCSSSLLAASFVNSIQMMFATFSVFYGIGTCFCITPIMTISTQYFDKYLTIAVGIITAGSSFGTLIYAPMSQALIKSIGWRNTFRCYAGFCLISAVCSVFIKPLSTKKSNDPEKLKQSPVRQIIQDLKLWKNRVFVIWTLAITLVMFGFYIPYVHLVSYAEDCGISPEEGSIFVMMLGACTAFGRILFGKIIQYGYLNRLHMHQFSMVVTGTGVMLLPLLKSFGGISAYVICVGLVDGCYVVLLPVLTASLVGLENAALAWGFLAGTSSITFTAGPPIAGALYDMMGSYDLAFHLAGLPIIAGALVLFLIPWAQRTSQTDNVMVVVSELDIAPDYDFADDILDETKILRSRENGSTTTLTGNTESNRNRYRELPYKMKTSQTRFRGKRFKDQETSTSPGSIHVPTDIHEALSMFHENAQMIAKLLKNSSGELIAKSTQDDLKRSGKSRSDMIQNTSFGVGGSAPQNVISIMSVPGGVAIGTFDKIFTQTTPSESISSNVSVNPLFNQRGGHGQNSETSSNRSKLFDDPYRVSSDVFSPTPSKVYQVYQFMSPECTETTQPVPLPTAENSEQASSTLTQTISEQLSKMRDSVTSPNEISESQEGNNAGQQQSAENIYVKNYISPCYVSSPPTLKSIPEVPPSRASTDSDLPGETQLQCTGDETIKRDPEHKDIPSSSSTCQVDLSNEPETNQAQGELDVFTHLFTDEQV